MKKKYMMAACACMSCVLLGSGTYVYARPETSVTNHFSTGVVDINLDEYELTANGGEEPFRDYTGKKGENPLIMPGDDISKIPRITNDGNDCYVERNWNFLAQMLIWKRSFMDSLLVGKNTMTDITIIKIS